MPETTEKPETWEVAYGFQFPLNSEQTSQERDALQDFVQALHAHLTGSLGLVGHEFAFDRRGRLLTRKTPTLQSDVARIGPGAKPVFMKLLEFLQQLDLTPPPPTFAEESVAPGEEAVSAPTRTLRQRLGQLLQELVRRTLPQRAPLSSSADASPFERREAHERTQFKKLQEWLDVSCRSGELHRAVLKWHQANLHSEASRTASVQRLPPVSQVQAFIQTAYDRWLEQLRRDPSVASVVHHRIRSTFHEMATRIIEQLTNDLAH